MNDIDTKKIIFYAPLFILVVIGIGFLFFDEDKIPEPIKIVQPKIIEQKEKTIIEIQYDIPKQEPKKEIVVVTKVVTKYIEKPILKKESKQQTKKVVKNIKLSDIDPYNLKTKEETVELSSTTDKNNKYTISLKSSQKIISTLPGSRYILLNGTVEEDSIKSNFSLSFNQYYKEYIEYISLEVKNNDTNITSSCDGSFLSGVESDYRYNLQCSLYGEMLSCYVEEEEESTNINNTKLPKDFKISDKEIPSIKNNTIRIQNGNIK
ncbi:MAG: hypothetical protein KAJ49_06485 [Arcobacteraceae bacterium]|nr:hypothetical protein [Arcobacteraceae bacterium]